MVGLLRASAGGDAIAARRLADHVLEPILAPPAVVWRARLVLTAACLHAAGHLSVDPTFAEVEGVLRALASRETSALADLAKSPQQIVQYVACECGNADDVWVEAATSLAIQALTAKLYTNR